MLMRRASVRFGFDFRLAHAEHFVSVEGPRRSDFLRDCKCLRLGHVGPSFRLAARFGRLAQPYRSPPSAGRRLGSEFCRIRGSERQAWLDREG
jgi:hypothetical protein